MTVEFNQEQRQALFTYFAVEHDILLIEDDFREMEMILSESCAEMDKKIKHHRNDALNSVK